MSPYLRLLRNRAFVIYWTGSTMVISSISRAAMPQILLGKREAGYDEQYSIHAKCVRRKENHHMFQWQTPR